MSLVYLRTKPGRIARVEPRGRFIPNDKFVPVQMTPYVDRLINFHGDVEVQDDKVVVEKPTKPAKPTEYSPTS